VALVPILEATGLVGCSMPLDQLTNTNTGTVRDATLRRMASLDMDRTAPVLIRIYKEEGTLEVWKQDRTGRFALLTTYPICRFSGTLGPKLFEGDYQAPEGFYDVTPGQMNPRSHEYLAFNIGFPNEFDRSLGRTGSFLMVHGGCRSVGCYAMTDRAMDEIYALVAEALEGRQDKVQLQAFPFRMTARNIFQHAYDPNIGFWKMLKAGSDVFEATRRPPSISVCNHRYVFRVEESDGLDAAGFCPSDTVLSDAAPARFVGEPLATSQPPPSRRDDPIARKIEEDLRGAPLTVHRPGAL